MSNIAVFRNYLHEPENRFKELGYDTVHITAKKYALLEEQK